MKKQTSLSLTINIEYDNNGVPINILEDLLKAIPSRLAGEGLFSGDTEATVSLYDSKVSETLNEKQIEKLGSEVIKLLFLKVKKNGRVDTGWGDKTPLGLGHTLLRFIEDSHKK